jgi:hypothetical protein
MAQRFGLHPKTVSQIANNTYYFRRKRG